MDVHRRAEARRTFVFAAQVGYFLRVSATHAEYVNGCSHLRHDHGNGGQYA